MKINVTEVSENYAYSLPTRRFATVAVPIMAAWGDGCIIKRNFDSEDASYGQHNNETSGTLSQFTYGDLQVLHSDDWEVPSTHNIPWQRFPATNEGVASFIATFRGACDKFSSVNDFSYGYAHTLLLSGYDVLVCRICDGVTAKNYKDGELPPPPPPAPPYSAEIINITGSETTPKLTIRTTNHTDEDVLGGWAITIRPTPASAAINQEPDNLQNFDRSSGSPELNNWLRQKDGTLITLTAPQSANSAIPANGWYQYDVQLRSVQNVSLKVEDWVVTPKPVEPVEPIDIEAVLPDIGADGYRPVMVSAKYPGTFGNRIWVRFRPYKGRFNQKTDTGTPVEQAWRTATVFVMDDQGVRKSVESFTFSITVDDSNDTAPYWREAYSGVSSKSKFVSLDAINPDCPIDEETGKVILVDPKNDPEKQALFLFNGSGNGTGIAGSGVNAPNHRWERRDFGFWISECVSFEDTAVRSGRQGTDYFLYPQDYASVKDSDGQYHIVNKFVAPRFTDPGNASDPGNVSRLWSMYYDSLSNSQLKLEAVRQAALRYCLYAIPALTDKIHYEYDVLMLPGWDDQNFGAEIAQTADGGDAANNDYKASQLQKVMAAVCVWSKCGVACLDAPRHAPFRCIKNHEDGGLAQQLAQEIPVTSVRFDNEDIGLDDTNNVVALDGEPLRATKATMLVNWVDYTFPILGNTKTAVSPTLANLLIRRSQLEQQALRQFWCQPTNQVHKVRFGKVDNRIGQVLLEYWQDNDRGVGVNPIVNDPDMGVVLRGNFTLFDNPEMSYNALRNLSTRYLFNEVAKAAFNAGRRIQLTYNNVTAMGRFKAAMYPVLDAMVDAQAIDGYLILINPDINGLDQVNANSVVGNIYLKVNGVVQDIDIALIALPPGTDLSQFTS